MSDKCKKKTSTLDVCDDMQVALRHGLLVRQTLHNRITRTKRERIVLREKLRRLFKNFAPLSNNHPTVQPSNANRNNEYAN